MKNRVKILRKLKKITQLELAERLKVSRQTVNSIENGRYDPSLTLAFAIAEAFDLTIEEIFIKDK